MSHQSQDGWLSVDAAIAKLVKDHGAWAILYRITEVLRPAFLAIEEAERKAKQPRKKPPPRECLACDGTGAYGGTGQDKCPECGGSGYLHGVEQ